MTSSLGLRIKKERERLGMTQGEFAEKLGIHRNTQARYETGAREPDAEYLGNAESIGCDYLYLLSGERTTPDSVLGLAAARILPAISERAGIDGSALLDLLHLAAEEEASTWKPEAGWQRGRPIDWNALQDALFADGALLHSVFYEVARILQELGAHLIWWKRAQVVLMFYRSSKETGQLDAKRLEEAVTLAAD